MRRKRHRAEWGLCHIGAVRTLASGPEWWSVGANMVVAVGTLLVAFVAAWVASREGRQRDRERRERESSQARLVTCTAGSESQRRFRFGLLRQQFVVTITNHSGYPHPECRDSPNLRWAHDSRTGHTIERGARKSHLIRRVLAMGVAA